jgi:hypothetical protein
MIGPRKVAKYNLQGHVKAISACHQYMGLVTITEASANLTRETGME